MLFILLFKGPSRTSRPILANVVVSGKPAIRVNWTAPESDITITRYFINYGKLPRPSSGRMQRIVQPSQRSYTLENLSAGTSYEVQVRADSQVGPGEFSEFVTITAYSCKYSIIIIFIGGILLILQLAIDT